MWTEKEVPPCANHGSLPYTPGSNWRRPLTISEGPFQGHPQHSSWQSNFLFFSSWFLLISTTVCILCTSQSGPLPHLHSLLVGPVYGLHQSCFPTGKEWALHPPLALLYVLLAASPMHQHIIPFYHHPFLLPTGCWILPPPPLPLHACMLLFQHHSLHPEDGGCSKVLCTVDTILQHYAASQPREHWYITPGTCQKPYVLVGTRLLFNSLINLVHCWGYVVLCENGTYWQLPYLRTETIFHVK